MGNTTDPVVLQDLMKILNIPISCRRQAEKEGNPDGPNMLEGSGIKFWGHMIQRNPVHVMVLLGDSVFTAVEMEMERLGLQFGMDDMGWQRPD